MYLLKESVVENKQEIDQAVKCKTDRLELCGDLNVGGVTPSEELINYCLATKVPTLIMIRLNDDQFRPNNADFKILKKQIKKYRKLPLAGFVFGFLTKDNKVDIKRTLKMKKLSRDKETIFSMAFDLIDNKFGAIDQLEKIGITRILTKGGSQPAMDNLEQLKNIVEYAKNKIQIIIGGKVTDDNFEKIAKATHAIQFHGRQLGIKL
jgi:copper homeostasis protein